MPNYKLPKELEDKLFMILIQPINGKWTEPRSSNCKLSLAFPKLYVVAYL